MLKRGKASHSLFRMIVTPVFMMMILLIVFFCFVSSMIILNLHNKNTLYMTEQSMEYVYRNLSFQLNNINSFLSTMTLEQEIETILERRTDRVDEQVSDYMRLYSSLQNYSLISIKADIGGEQHTQVSYFISVIVGEESSLYGIANSQFSIQPGLYKEKNLKNQGWYQNVLDTKDNSWWIQEENGSTYLCLAKLKHSIKDGKKLGVFTLAYDLSNVRALLSRSITSDEGFFVLMDQQDQTVFNPKHASIKMENMPRSLYSQKNIKSTLIQEIQGVNHIIMMNSFNNGWRLFAFVPEKSIKKYTEWVTILGFLAVTVSITISGLVLRRTANRVRMPVEILVSAMKKIELENFEESFFNETKIGEIDELYKGYNYMVTKINQLIRDVYIKEIERKQMHLNLLQSQINPHFLYNTLDIINCMAITAGAKDISKVTRALANVFRLGLNRGRDFILLEDELKQVKSYLDIQEMMHADLHVEYTLDQSIGDARVLNLIVQPLVENSILHGFKNKQDQCILVISSRLERDMVVIGVWDNGKGVDPDFMNDLLGRGRDKQGYGVFNVDKRIKLHFGDTFGIRYLSVETGTFAEIWLPFCKKEFG